MVTLRVGSQGKAYVVHKDLLCHYSKYFSAAFNGLFKEAQEKELKLAEVEPRVFDTVMGWLYTQHLDLEDADAKSEHGDGICACADRKTVEVDSRLPSRDVRGNSAHIEKRFRVHPVDTIESLIVQLAMFADEYDCQQLRNATLDAFHERFKDSAWLPALCVVQTMFEGLPQGSKLVAYTQSMLWACLDGQQLEHLSSELSSKLQAVLGVEFWFKMAKIYRNAYQLCQEPTGETWPWNTVTPRQPVWDRDTFCRVYHDHDTDEEGCNCRGAGIPGVIWID
jgi:hypothetical protein